MKNFIDAFAIIDKNKTNKYILFNFDNQGNPILNVFDIRHKKYANNALSDWKKTEHHSKARLIKIKMYLEK